MHRILQVVSTPALSKLALQSKTVVLPRQTNLLQLARARSSSMSSNGPSASSASTLPTMTTATMLVEVDVIVPVHNAAATIKETLLSAARQVLPADNHVAIGTPADIKIFVCCYDDGSTDDSWEIMQQIAASAENGTLNQNFLTQSGKNDDGIVTTLYLPTNFVLGKSEDGTSRGAGYARNRAVDLRKNNEASSSASTNHYDTSPAQVQRFLCMLDSDDVMKPTRIAEQVQYLLSIRNYKERHRTLVGCTFERDPPDSTWHYSQWANSLTRQRLYLEQFRECTLLQPTWTMARSWFTQLGGYLEAPSTATAKTDDDFSVEEFLESLSTATKEQQRQQLQVIHTSFETAQTLRVAEDARFFYKHLHAGGQLGLVRPAASANNKNNKTEPLLIYRHRQGQSQSFQTPRKLLLHIRVRAFEEMILSKNMIVADNQMQSTTASITKTAGAGEQQNRSPTWQKFCVWGAGRDGKDFVKALRPEFRKRIVCMVDVDEKKIGFGYYFHKELGLNIPVVHFSLLARDEKLRKQLRVAFEEGSDANQPGYGRLQKNKDPPPIKKDEQQQQSDEKTVAERPRKRRKVSHVEKLDESILPSLPVVVCVAMYRTGGALEHNVQSIGRTEGVDLWHFS